MAAFGANRAASTWRPRAAIRTLSEWKAFSTIRPVRPNGSSTWKLGVSSIVPLETAHTAGVATRLKDAHGAKLGRVVLEATKQCGAAWAPTVEPVLPLAKFLARPIQGTGWLADPAGAPPPATLDDTPLTVVIGPEGGFTDEERAGLVSAGYRPVTLGTNSLRFETAALAAAAVAGTARLRGNHG